MWAEGSEADYGGARWVGSPNYWEGRQGHAVTHIVMHGTAGPAPGALAWLRDPASVASVHYLVDVDGGVWQLVAEEDAAWGNGVPEAGSPFLGGPNPNLFTISIEHERADAANEAEITEAQQAASTGLVADIRRRRGLLEVIPHSLISPLTRARCPGVGFPLAEIEQASRLGATRVSGRAQRARGAGAAPRKYVVTCDMKARWAPNVFCWYVPLQLCYRGATLEGTGRMQAGWVEVVAGGRPVWLLGSNLRKVA